VSTVHCPFPFSGGADLCTWLIMTPSSALN